MITKSDYVMQLHNEYIRWNKLFGMNKRAGTKKILNGYNRVLTDVMVHLLAWQQVSSARLSAAFLEQPPEYPKWLEGFDPDVKSNELTDTCNTCITEIYHNVPQDVVIDSWRDGYLSFIRIVEELSEEILFKDNAFEWLRGYALKDVVEGTLAHHREHYEYHTLDLENKFILSLPV